MQLIFLALSITITCSFAIVQHQRFVSSSSRYKHRMAAQVSAETTIPTTPGIHQSCFCGAVALVVNGPPVIGRSYCHCSICRRLSGAPFSANGLWPASQVALLKGQEHLHSLVTSKKVTRFRCSECGSPIKADLMGGKAVALPLSSFNPEQLLVDGWSPQHHLHYSSRSVDVNDNLPKYSSGSNGPVCSST